MEKLTCRLLPFEVADGPSNMALDEVLLQSAHGGAATLRFYGWSEPTLSLGYFQSAAVRLDDPRLTSLPFVRRPSGGEALVHHVEITYALALPAGPWLTLGPWLYRMHQTIADALKDLGIEVQLHGNPAIEPGKHLRKPATSPLCFHHATPGDVMVRGTKVVGSAQRKQRGALMQHGAILLARSSHSPTLAGIRELTGSELTASQVVGAVQGPFVEATNALLVEGELSREEIEQRQGLIAEKYRNAEWNSKR